MFMRLHLHCGSWAPRRRNGCSSWISTGYTYEYACVFVKLYVNNYMSLFAHLVIARQRCIGCGSKIDHVAKYAKLLAALKLSQGTVRAQQESVPMGALFLWVTRKPMVTRAATTCVFQFIDMRSRWHGLDSFPF